MRKILITGGTGNIGKAVLSKISEDISVILLSRNSNFSLKRRNCRCVIFDPLRYDSIPNDLWNATEVLHMAGATSETDSNFYYTVNTELTKRLVCLSEANDVKRFTYISTQAIGKSGGHYSNSKLQAEKLISNSKLNWTILRPSEVYGSGINSMVTKLCKLINASYFIPVIGDGLYCLNPVHVDDLSDFIDNLLMNESGLANKKLYTLCGPKPETFMNFCIAQANKSKKTIYFIKIPLIICKLFVKLCNIFGLNFIAFDQISRLVMKKSNDFSQATNDFGFKPRFFKSY